MKLENCRKEALIEIILDREQTIVENNTEVDTLHEEISGKDAEIKFLLNSVEINNIAYRSQVVDYLKGLESKLEVQKYDIEALQEVVENLTNKKDKEYIQKLEKLIIKNAIKEVK